MRALSFDGFGWRPRRRADGARPCFPFKTTQGGERTNGEGETRVNRNADGATTAPASAKESSERKGSWKMPPLPPPHLRERGACRRRPVSRNMLEKRILATISRPATPQAFSDPTQGIAPSTACGADGLAAPAPPGNRPAAAPLRSTAHRLKMNLAVIGSRGQHSPKHADDLNNEHQQQV